MRRLFGLWLVVVWLHRGKENDFLDVVGIGEEHAEPVDSHAPPSRRRETILERSAVPLIEEHGLVVAGSLILSLKKWG